LLNLNTIAFFFPCKTINRILFPLISKKQSSEGNKLPTDFLNPFLMNFELNDQNFQPNHDAPKKTKLPNYFSIQMNFQ
jgi:hypothetical protein